MRKSATHHAPSAKPHSPMAVWNKDPTILVCTGMMLALIALLFRIASFW